MKELVCHFSSTDPNSLLNGVDYLKINWNLNHKFKVFPIHWLLYGIYTRGNNSQLEMARVVSSPCFLCSVDENRDYTGRTFSFRFQTNIRRFRPLGFNSSVACKTFFSDLYSLVFRLFYSPWVGFSFDCTSWFVTESFM